MTWSFANSILRHSAPNNRFPMTRKIQGRPLKHWRQGNGKPGSAKGGVSNGRQAELRIIGGAMRGRKFAYSGDLRTRPMMDTTREALFNLIGGWTKDKIAIDLFAGTGAVGFEAISRGAKRAMLIERHIPTAELIRKNAQALEIESRIEVAQSDAFFWANEFLADLERAKAVSKNTAGDQQADVPVNKDPETAGSATGSIAEFLNTPWIVFICPPYDFFVEREEQTLALIEKMFAAAPAGSVLAVESDMRFGFKCLPQADQWKVRQYSPAQIAVWRPEAD